MSSKTMPTTTFPRLPGLTLTQRRAVQLMQQARKQADIETARTIKQLRAPSATTHREPIRKRRDVMLLPIVDATQPISIAAGWPQWMLGAVLLLTLFVGAALMSLARDSRGNVEATTGWTDTPVRP